MRSTAKVLLLLILSLGFFAPLQAENTSGIDPINIARALSTAFEQAASKITPGLVTISSLKRLQNQESQFDPRLGPFKDFLGDEMFRRYFGAPPASPGQPGTGHNPLMPYGLGSGFVISADGYILTNNHVIDGADAVKVQIDNRNEVEAKVVGTDPQTDIAVLKVELPGLAAVEFGNSDLLAIGEWVIAAGNPFGLDHSITAGIVSARGRSVSHGDMYEDFIQTDAAINVGNSGGPLLNLEGKVVGMNTMILSRSGGNQGIGFAIPINMARNIADQLIKSGKVTRGWLGIAIQDLTNDLKNSFSFDGKGVLVGDVTEGSPGDRGGLSQGDIVLSINDVTTESANELRNYVATLPPGSAAKVRVLRASAQRVLSVTLGTRPENPGEQFNSPVQNPSPAFNEQLGLHLQTLTEEKKAQLGIESQGNVLVADVQPHSAGYRAGLRQGDILLKAAQKDLPSVESFMEVVASSDLNVGIRLVVESRGMKRFAILKNE